MARRSTLDNILEVVSADNSLREALLGRLMSGANENGSFSSQHVSRADHPPRTTSQSLPCFPAFGTQMCQSGLNSPAVTQMCQPGRAGNPIGHANVPIGKCQCLAGHANVPVGKCNPLVTQMCQTGSANLWTTSIRASQEVEMYSKPVCRLW